MIVTVSQCGNNKSSKSCSTEMQFFFLAVRHRDMRDTRAGHPQIAPPLDQVPTSIGFL
jgi:hypothetical protein